MPYFDSNLLLDALEKSGRSAREVSLAAVGHESAIRSIKRGLDLRASTISALCRELGLEFYIGPKSTENLNKNKFKSENPALAVPPEIVFALNLPEGASPDDVVLAIQALLSDQTNERWTVLETEIKALRESIQKLTPDNHIAEPPALYETVDKDDVASARPVSVMELAAAAGGGALELDERVVGQVWFRRDWLDRKGIDSTQCNIISVKGESMEPTLPDGCSILVDRSRQRRHSGHIFVLLTADGLVVKRLGKDADSHWQLLSDHSGWKAMAWQPDTTVVGEVMWVARSL